MDRSSSPIAKNHRRNAARSKTLDYEQYGQMVSVSTAKHRDRRCYDGVAGKQRQRAALSLVVDSKYTNCPTTLYGPADRASHGTKSRRSEVR
jgi:hypothetical protein